MALICTTQRRSKLTELLSLITEAVRPAADDPFPEVYTAIGAVFSTNLRNFTNELKSNQHVSFGAMEEEHKLSSLNFHVARKNRSQISWRYFSTKMKDKRRSQSSQCSLGLVYSHLACGKIK